MPTETAPVRFRQRAELLDFLLEVSAAISESLTDLDSVLANIARIIRQVVPYDLFAILLYNDKQKNLRIRYAIGHREEVVKNLVVRLGEGLTGTAATLRQPILARDVRKDSRYLNALDAVRAELAVPMIARGKLVGIIDLESTRLNAYSEYDLSLLRVIAARVAVTIDNARLFRRVERQNRTLRLLSQLSHEFSSILDLNDLLQRIAGSVKTLINYDAFSILLLDREQNYLRHRFSVRHDRRVNLDNIPVGKGITGTSASTRAVVRSHDTLQDPRYIPSHADVRSEVAVPLLSHDVLVGVMDLESDHFAYFTDEHVRMLSLLAAQIASSVENARLYEELALRERRIGQDLEAARELQVALLAAEPPQIKGLEIAFGYRPARIIGGDLYHFFDYNDGAALITMGDVSGKGVAAALYGALVSGLLRTMAPTRRDPALLLRLLNQALMQRKVEARYIALLLLLWQPDTRQLTMANSGALAPVICRGREIIQPKVEGVPLGLLPDREYDKVTFQAEPGDVVVLYSDGITDQLNPDGEDYGRRRVLGLLKQACHGSPQSVIDAIFADLDGFTASGAVFDDQTIVVLKVT
jgi:sigma-B regulation protein RsbU (phosphoserine phosphatase)